MLKIGRTNLAHNVIIPVQLANELENLVARVASQDIVEEMSNVELHRGAFFRWDRGSFGRITLSRRRASQLDSDRSSERRGLPGSKRSRAS